MPRYAVCDINSNIVQTVILANPTDPVYTDTYFYPLGDDEICNPGWICTGTSVYDPNPPQEP